MKNRPSYVIRWPAWAARPPRWAIVCAALALASLLTVAWFVRLATVRARHSGETLALDEYGLPGVSVRIVSPTYLSTERHDLIQDRLTVLARATSADAATPFNLLFPLPDDSVSFVDASGRHIQGLLRITPGYPIVRPHDLRVVHGDTQYGGRSGGRRLEMTPILEWDDTFTPLEEIGFVVRLEPRWVHSLRQFASSFTVWATPLIVVGLVLVLALAAWNQVSRRRRMERERHLAARYTRLREQVKLERWSDARREIDGIRLLVPRYRDLEQLETQVTAAETALWRCEQLYAQGVSAYRGSDWPRAVQAFSSLESESPYYRDVRFLRRTAALYADLASRDRSLRIKAAQALGEVGDLLDAQPLVYALGDPSQDVADRAEEALRAIGSAAYDSILGGLVSESEHVRDRSRNLLTGVGQDARPYLAAALRSSRPDITGEVAKMLAELGARRELADALLHVDTAHLEGIAQALLRERAASFGPLLYALRAAPTDRQQMIINVLAALKLWEDVDRHLRDEIRRTKSAESRELLQRALDASPAPFRIAGEGPDVDLGVEATPSLGNDVAPQGKGLARRLRLLDRRHD